MKKMAKLLTVFLIMLVAVPVFAEEPISNENEKKEEVTIESILGTTLNDEVVLNATNSIDVTFNELKQDATYKITLKNNTEELLYVNDVVAENISEDFIEFSLDEKSVNATLEPGKEKVVEVQVKTLDITHAGRNLSDEVTLKVLLGKAVVNPETSRNWIVYVILIGTLLITISTMFSKLDKKKKLSIFVIGTLVLGTTIVSANDDDVLTIPGKVTYISQNLLQESGTKLDDYRVSYVNSLDVWKYADQVKNIIISDDMDQPSEYDHKYDLTINDSKKIYGYLVENKTNKASYDLYIVSNGVIYAPVDSTGLFSFPNVETIKGLDYIEFDNTTNMTAMFMNNEKLKSLDTSAINTSNVTNTSYMFNGCDNLKVKEKDLNLEKVTNKKHMFNQDLIDVVKLNATSDKNTDFSATPVTGKYMIESTKNDTNPVYYYRGSVTDNNVLFGGYCWKMVRTTDTGGVKMIYNGTPNDDIIATNAIAVEDYKIVSNDSSNKFVFDSTTNKWSSTNHGHSSNSSFSFEIANAGNYIINYDVSSEANFDYISFYKNNSLIGQYSGNKTGIISLGLLRSSDVIKVTYRKDGSVSNGSDSASFYLSNSYETKLNCNNSGINSKIGISSFNANADSPAYAGYMYGDIYTTQSMDLASQSSAYVYGNDVEWDGSKYKLLDTRTSSRWSTDRNSLAARYHYTCFSSSDSCERVYYISYFGDNNGPSYLTMNDGKKLDDILDEMFENKNDSTIKTYIDNWFENNLNTFVSDLEDTVWCNDRTLTGGSLSGKDVNSTASSLFASYTRSKNSVPSLNCSNIRDSFTVSKSLGNGKLTYPVGLITADEYTYAGNGYVGSSTSAYLYTPNSYQWTLSPFNYIKVALNFHAMGGTVNNLDVVYELAVRPAISLKAGTDYVSGTGTVNDPYIVE